MVDSVAAAYASFSYASQTTSLSVSLQQNQNNDKASDSGGASDNSYSFSLGYTTTTTVATISLLYVQESANSNEPRNDNGGKQEKSALQSVLDGPKDPFNPIEDALKSFYSDDQEGGHRHSERGQGRRLGHSIRDNTYGQTKNDVQAAYSSIQLEVSTTTVEFRISA